MRKKFGLARARASNHGPIVGRSYDFERVLFERIDPNGLPVVGGNTALYQRHGQSCVRFTLTCSSNAR